MPTLRTKLTPFWYEPEFHQDADKVKFHLRPLTQRDMVEIDEYCERNGDLTGRAQYEAGLKAIIAVRGLTDEDGNEARWPACAPFVDRHHISQAGARAVIEQTGGNWAAIVQKMRQTLGLEVASEAAPDPAGDPEKN